MQKKSWEHVDHGKEDRKLAVVFVALIVFLIGIVAFFVWLRMWV